MADRKALVMIGGEMQELPAGDALGIEEPRFRAVNTQADDYTLVLADAARQILMSKATATTLTVPPESSVAFATGTVIPVTQYGAGAVTIAAGSGVTIRTSETLNLAKQYASASLRKIGADEWLLDGYLESA